MEKKLASNEISVWFMTKSDVFVTLSSDKVLKC